MKERLSSGFLAFVLCSALAGSSVSAATTPARDPKAIEALKHMGAYLRTLKSFEIVARTSTDQVTDQGQALTFFHTTTLDVQLPNRMKIEVANSGARRELVYDGATFTIYRSAQNLYARASAPPTVDGMVDELAQRYGIATPLADLFNWGLDAFALNDLSTALVVGEDTIAGQRCTHYAFRQPQLDWEIWIRANGNPLPCQLVLTSLSDSARPRHSVQMQWNLSPSFAATAFAFTPPKDARKIALRELNVEKVQ